RANKSHKLLSYVILSEAEGSLAIESCVYEIFRLR
ncbi:MAG: hypothetical protein ACI854_002397, partial [Arenicella sp.]